MGFPHDSPREFRTRRVSSREKIARRKCAGSSRTRKTNGRNRT